jgi:hypothetical protein
MMTVLGAFCDYSNVPKIRTHVKYKPLTAPLKKNKTPQIRAGQVWSFADPLKWPSVDHPQLYVTPLGPPSMFCKEALSTRHTGFSLRTPRFTPKTDRSEFVVVSV